MRQSGVPCVFLRLCKAKLEIRMQCELVADANMLHVRCSSAKFICLAH